MPTTLFLKQQFNSAVGVSGGVATYQYASLSRSVLAFLTAITNTVTAGTNIQMTQTAGGLLVAFISPPVSAPFTLAGNVTFNLWAKVNLLAANTTVAVSLIKFSGGAEGAPFLTSSFGTAVTTTIGAKNWTGSPSSTPFAVGDRLVIKCLITNATSLVMVAGDTLTMDYAGLTASADGDSFITLTENVNFQTEAELIQYAPAVVAGTITMPGKTTTGSTIVLITEPFFGSGETLLSASDGTNPYVLKVSGLTQGLFIALAQNIIGTAAPTITPAWSSGTGNAFLIAVEIAGVANVSLDTIGSVGAGTSTAPVSGAATTSFPREMLVTIGDCSGSTVTPQAGFINRGTEGFWTDSSVSTLQTGITASPTISPSASWAICLLCFKWFGQPPIPANSRVGQDSPLFANPCWFGSKLFASGSAGWFTRDLITANLISVRSLTDTLSFSDALARAAAFSRTNTDTASFSDSPVRTSGHPRVVSDTSSFNDTLARLVAFARALTDTTSFSDSPTKNVAFSRSLSDTQSYSDSPQRGVGRSLSDTLSFSDSIIRALALIRTFSDSVSFNDTPARTVSLPRAASDASSFSDAIARSVASPRSISDSQTTSESIQRGVGRNASDALSYSDVLSRITAFARALSDTEVVSEAIQRDSGRSASDTVSYSDVITRALTLARILSDTESFSDVPTRTVAESRSAGDSSAFSDSLSRSAALSRAPTDTFSFSDVVVRTLAFARSLSDTQNFSEDVERAAGLVRALSDTESFSDSLTRALAIARTVSDTFSFTEVVFHGLVRFLTDTFSFSDSAGANVTLARSFVDSLSFSDTSNRATGYGRTINDSVSFADTVARVLALVRTATDTNAATDSLARTTAATRLVTDSYSLVENLTRGLATLRAIADTAAFSEVVGRGVSVIRNLSDALSFSDFPTHSNAAQHLFVTAEDTFTTTDSATRLVALEHALEDALAFSDELDYLLRFSTWYRNQPWSDKVKQSILNGAQPPETKFIP